jgi:glucan phosphoethanolaminetransferase (alkaline phosphatase superfamily)
MIKLLIIVILVIIILITISVLFFSNNIEKFTNSLSDTTNPKYNPATDYNAIQRNAIQEAIKTIPERINKILISQTSQKDKKVTSTECLHRDVRLEVSVQVKPFTYDVT